MAGKGKAGGGPPGGKGGGKGEILEAMKAARAEADAEVAAKTEADRAALIARGIDPEEEAERLREEKHARFAEAQAEAVSELAAARAGLSATEEDDNKRKERLQNERNLPMIMKDEEDYWRLTEECYMGRWLPVLGEHTFKAEQILMKTEWLTAVNAAHHEYQTLPPDSAQPEDAVAKCTAATQQSLREMEQAIDAAMENLQVRKGGGPPSVTNPLCRTVLSSVFSLLFPDEDPLVLQ